MFLPTSIVLLSGGLDSLAALHWAQQNSDVMMALTFDYGQLASQKEIKAAAQICRHYDIKHCVVTLPWLGDMKRSALTNPQNTIPELSLKDLDDFSITQESAKAVWVPNRNGVFINVAASLAEFHEYDWIVVGFNLEEAQTFSDNSDGFVNVVNVSLEFSTKRKVELKSPMSSLYKKQIVQWCVEQGVDLLPLWSCYRGEDKMCGHCESCLRCRRALMEAQATQVLERLF